MPIVWWEIETPKPELFQQFHAAMWGWSFRVEFTDTELAADYWVIVDETGSIGGLSRSTTDIAPQAGVRLYLEVADLEATLIRVTALGGIAEQARTSLGGNDRWFGTALDPVGISFGLWTSHPPRNGTD